jgi:hypothetical protein
MGAMQRRKGANFEREIVNAALAFGLEARRTAPNQTQDGSESFGDVTIQSLKIECKHHKKIPHWNEILAASLLDIKFKPVGEIAQWLKGHDALIMKQTGLTVPLVLQDDGQVMTLATFLGSLKDHK